MPRSYASSLALKAPPRNRGEKRKRKVQGSGKRKTKKGAQAGKHTAAKPDQSNPLPPKQDAAATPQRDSTRWFVSLAPPRKVSLLGSRKHNLVEKRGGNGGGSFGANYGPPPITLQII